MTFRNRSQTGRRLVAPFWAAAVAIFLVSDAHAALQGLSTGTRTFRNPLESFLSGGIASSKQKQQQQQRQDLLDQLNELVSQAPRNGIDTPPALEAQIADTCRQLETYNPTPAPAEKCSGFWKLQWTNFAPAAPSSGKLGPFVGDVYQDISFSQATKNIFVCQFPPISGQLQGKASLVNDRTIALEFVSVATRLAGWLPLGPKVEFPPQKEVRLWEHIYLDDTYRILYARRLEEPAADNRGFLYVMTRADDERFELDF